jgi:hypothetical protein
MSFLPRRVRVQVEVARGAFARREKGRVRFVSPVPAPFAYGFLPGTLAPDGDEADVVLYGIAPREGSLCEVDVHGIVRFVDDGVPDDKLVAGHPPGPAGLAALGAFFRVYAPARRLLNAMAGRRGRTAFLAIEVPRRARR